MKRYLVAVCLLVLAVGCSAPPATFTVPTTVSSTTTTLAPTTTIAERSIGLIVTIGDSIVAGHPAHDPDPNVYDAADDPASSFQFHLRSVPADDVINKGVGSERTEQALARFETDALSLSPAYVLILCGVNDISEGTPAAQTQANLDAMYQATAEVGAVPILATTPPWNNGTTEQKAQVAQLNKWIRGQAASNGWPLVDFYAALGGGADSVSEQNTVDGLHPSRHGYAVMAEALDEVLAGL